MKYLRKFLESDSWAGSSLAYDNPLVKTPWDKVEIKPKQSWSYQCDDCGIEFITFNNKEGNCKLCGSENIYPVSNKDS
jgi:rRNA maturation endonuclease Nob1